MVRYQYDDEVRNDFLTCYQTQKQTTKPNKIRLSNIFKIPIGDLLIVMQCFEFINLSKITQINSIVPVVYFCEFDVIADDT